MATISGLVGTHDEHRRVRTIYRIGGRAWLCLLRAGIRNRVIRSRERAEAEREHAYAWSGLDVQYEQVEGRHISTIDRRVVCQRRKRGMGLKTRDSAYTARLLT